MATAGPTDKHARTEGEAATSLAALAEWVGEIAGLAKPDAVVWCDGSQAEWDRLTSLLVENGTFTGLNPEPWRGWRTARSSARSGSRTPARPTTGSRRMRCARRSGRSSTGAWPAG